MTRNHRHLRASLICFAIAAIVIALWLQGCAHDVSIRPVCRHKATLCAVTMGEKYPVRICSGPVPGSHSRHAQAEAKIDGKWQPLTFSGGVVSVGRKDDYKPDGCYKFNHLMFPYLRGQFEKQ